MNTIRRAKHDRSYTVIENATIQNSALSWRGRGMLAYLLSLPDDWRVNIEDLTNRSEQDGKHSTREAIKELMEAGHITRQRCHNESGKFIGYEYVVYESVKTVVQNSDDGKTDDGKTDDGKLNTTKYPSNKVPNIQSTHREDAPKKKSVSRFTPPTLEELNQAFKEKLREKKVSGADFIARREAEKFFNHYEANGWKVGRAKMKSWPHAVAGWIGRMDNYNTNNHANGSKPDNGQAISADDAHAIIADIVANGW